MSTLTEAEEIHIAEIDRSLALVAQVWEDDANMSVDKVCELLEGINDIVIQNCNFSEFVETSNLKGRERLN